MTNIVEATKEMEMKRGGEKPRNDYHSLLPGIFLIQRLNSGLLHGRQNLYCLSHKGLKLYYYVCEVLLGKAKVKLSFLSPNVISGEVQDRSLFE